MINYYYFFWIMKIVGNRLETKLCQNYALIFINFLLSFMIIIMSMLSSFCYHSVKWKPFGNRWKPNYALTDYSDFIVWFIFYYHWWFRCLHYYFGSFFSKPFFSKSKKGNGFWTFLKCPYRNFWKKFWKRGCKMTFLIIMHWFAEIIILEVLW